MAKVLGFVGSPRRGANTDTMVKAILEGARESGAETEIFYLNEMHIRGCQACEKCKETKMCATEDDMLPLHQKIIEAEGIVIGSPIFAHYITGQTKIFIDRWYAFLDQNLTSWIPKGKRITFAISHNDDGIDDYRSTLASLSCAMNVLHPEFTKALILPGTKGTDDAANNPSFLKQAKDMGKLLAG